MKIIKIIKKSQQINNDEANIDKKNEQKSNYTVRSMLKDLSKWESFFSENVENK